MTEFILITGPILFLVCLVWVLGIDKMNREHPDYKGEDYLDEDF